MNYLRYLALAFVFILLAGFALAFSVYQSYTELAEFNRSCKTKFADWEAALAPRRGMIAELAEITEQYDDHAGDLLLQADQVLSEAPASSALETRIAMHLLYGKTLNDLRALALRYPQLKDASIYRDWETGYLKNQITEEAARMGYNTAALDYNAVLDSFSGKLISLIFSVPAKPIIPG